MRYLYVIKGESDHYKIGSATNVNTRLKQLQTSSATKLSIICTVIFKDAFKVEHDVHRKLQNYQTQGGTEWFKLSAEQLIKVLKMIYEYPRFQLSEDALIMADIARKLDRIESKLNNKVFPKYEDKVLSSNTKSKEEREADKDDTNKKEYEQAMNVLRKYNKASTSLLQRELRIGYSKAARIIQDFELGGYIGMADGLRPREVFLDKLDVST